MFAGVLSSNVNFVWLRRQHSNWCICSPLLIISNYWEFARCEVLCLALCIMQLWKSEPHPTPARLLVRRRKMCAYLHNQARKKYSARESRWIAKRSWCISGTVDCFYSRRKQFLMFFNHEIDVRPWESSLFSLGLSPTSENRGGSLNDTVL